MDQKRRQLRLTVGGMILLVALAAVLIDFFRPQTTRIIDVKLGNGPAVKAGDTVLVHYIGKLANGTTFDGSKPRNTPFEFIVGGKMVIKGWDGGLIGMQTGGIRQLIIPPTEAYGANGMPPMIPPNSQLLFEVELLQIK